MIWHYLWFIKYDDVEGSLNFDMILNGFDWFKNGLDLDDKDK
jgi:hypothetical protein